jgi:hypothetical protein
MAIFNSYVSLPEGIYYFIVTLTNQLFGTFVPQKGGQGVFFSCSFATMQICKVMLELVWYINT